LQEQLEKIAAEDSERSLHIALGMAPRRLGREDVQLSEADLAAAHEARPGWDPRQWSIDGAARVLILLSSDPASFPARFTDLCRSADVAEAVALYRGLPLYPQPEALEAQAAEGVRSNMRAVFEAVAHRNPYPREQFDESRWNQMVLKALFVGSTLHPIQGLDERANAGLAATLCDYAHERWAAGRPVAAELWRCVGPFAEGPTLEDLKRTLSIGDPAERQAAALALTAAPAPEAKALLATVPQLAGAIESGRLTWETLSTE
jgi:hypothetical protein